MVTYITFQNWGPSYWKRRRALLFLGSSVLLFW